MLSAHRSPWYNAPSPHQASRCLKCNQLDLVCRNTLTASLYERSSSLISMFFNPPTDEDFGCAFSWHNIVWTQALCSVMYEYIHSEELLPLIRYLGPTGFPESHKHGYYSDGTRAKPLDNPPSPGLFPAVDPAARRLLVRCQRHEPSTRSPLWLLGAICTRGRCLEADGDDKFEAMESRAFAEMLHSGIRVRVNGAVLFRLYAEFGLGSCPR